MISKYCTALHNPSFQHFYEFQTQSEIMTNHKGASHFFKLSDVYILMSIFFLSEITSGTISLLSSGDIS